MAAAHVPIPARPGTLLIALPTELVHVVLHKEFMNCLKAKALIHAKWCLLSHLQDSRCVFVALAISNAP